MASPRTAFLCFVVLVNVGRVSVQGLSSFKAPSPSTQSVARQQIQELLQERRKTGGNAVEYGNPNLGQCIDQLLQEEQATNMSDNFTPAEVAGTWHVVYAPHIAGLSNVFLTKFQPIEYHLTEDSKMSSSVRYNSFLAGYGWFCTAGYYESMDKATPMVKIVWDQAWWNVAYLERPTPPEEGFAADLIQQIGMAGFIERLSQFPVKYVDKDFAIFQFLGWTIAAARVADPKPAVFVSGQDA